MDRLDIELRVIEEKEQIIDSFTKKGYEVSWFDSAKAAAEYLNQKIDGKTVGFGDSETFRQMDLYEKFSVYNKIADPIHCPEEKFNEVAKEALDTEVFLTSVNAASIQGELVNIDGTGNRVAGSLFGHDEMYFVFGINKFAPDLTSAVKRAREVAAPINAKRWNLKTPCVADGKCHDCSSPDRICNDLLIHFHAPTSTSMKCKVIIIEENLGF